MWRYFWETEQEFGGPLLENRLEIYCCLQYSQFDNSTCTVSSTTVLSVRQQYMYCQFDKQNKNLHVVMISFSESN